MKKLIFVAMFVLILVSAFAGNIIRVFTWDGYVPENDVKAVNKILKEKGYDYSVEVIKPLAEGPDQMFDVIRSGKADISFLTLNYLKLRNGRLLRLLQPINTNSPRLTNYKKLEKSLTDIGMGMKDGKHYYIPWGGGAYGLWANMDKLKNKDLPKSVKELWKPKWTKKIALTKGQIEPNIAIALLALDLPPFYINDIVENRKALSEVTDPNGKIQKKVTGLYRQVGDFWDAGPNFRDDLLLVASYGIGAFAENSKGGNWKLVSFKEGNTVWLDTMNLYKDLSGKKLEAAEIFMNYFIGPKVQNRVAKGLGMVAASTLVKDNTLLKENPNFFSEKMFWPPYKVQAQNVMQAISNKALKDSHK